MAYNALNPIMSAYMGGGVKVYTDLDPIDPETVGRANVPAMLTWAMRHKLTIFVMLFTITISGATWMESINDPKPAFIDARYLAHLQQLSKVGLVLDRDQLQALGHTKRWIRHWSRYFAVEKTATTSRSNETDVIEKRIRTNIAATALNVEIKGKINRSTDKVTYLGMQVAIARSDTKPVLHVYPSKLDKWSQTILKDEDTCRAYASFVGRVLFFASLEHPNLRMSTIGKAGLQMAQQVGVLAHRHGWDHRMTLPDGLVNAWARVLSSAENPVQVRCRDERAVHATTVLATDASSEGWGIVVFDVSGKHMMSSDGDSWRAEDKRWLLRSSADEHIFYKELRAVLYGLSRLPDDASAIVVVDNAAVAWVLRNGFSRTLLGNALLKSSEHLLHKIHDVVLVVSHDNPADSPSRGKDVEADRV
jgi:hypothetical protein